MYIELQPVSFIPPGKYLTLADRFDIHTVWTKSWATQIADRDSEFLTDHLVLDLKEMGANYRIQFVLDVVEWISKVGGKIDVDAATTLQLRWTEASVSLKDTQIISQAVNTLGPLMQDIAVHSRDKFIKHFGRFLRDSAQFYQSLHRAMAITEAWLTYYPDNGEWDNKYTYQLTQLMLVNGSLTNPHRLKAVHQIVGNGQNPYTPKRLF